MSVLVIVVLVVVAHLYSCKQHVICKKLSELISCVLMLRRCLVLVVIDVGVAVVVFLGWLHCGCCQAVWVLERTSRIMKTSGRVKYEKCMIQ